MPPIIATFVSVCALLGLAHLAKPRLPQYTFQLSSSLPSIGYDLQTVVYAQVELQNDNFAPMDIYSLYFDLYFPDGSGQLHPIARVQDAPRPSSRNDTKTTTKKSSNHTNTVQQQAQAQAPPLWQLKARSPFSASNQAVIVQHKAGLSVLPHLVSTLVWNYSSTVQIPSTGVIHLKVHSKLPITLCIVCNNSLAVDTLTMTGLHCDLNALDVGWAPPFVELERMQQELLGTG